MEEKKDLELVAANSRLEDDPLKSSSSNNIPQNGAVMQPDWCFTDEEELFNGSDDTVSGESQLNAMQIALQNSIKKEEGMIPDNIVLPCVIDKGELYYTSSSNTPIVKLICSVNDGTSSLKSIEDIFIFGNDYIESTIDRLNTVLSRFNYHLTNEDVKDYSSIAEAINRLRGRKAKIKQYEKNNDKKYWYYNA